MDHFYNNSLQTGLMRDLAIDLELLGEHVILLGNQGVGKNKIVDRLCQVGFPCTSPCIMLIGSYDTSSFVAHASMFSFIGTRLSINLCSRRHWTMVSSITLILLYSEQSSMGVISSLTRQIRHHHMSWRFSVALLVKAS